RRKFVEHDAEQRAVDLSPLLLTFVPLANNELQILKEHLAERAHRLGIFIHVERHEENQLLFDDIVDRKQILIRTRDHGQFIVEKGHARVEETLDLRYAVPVLERLKKILHRHFKVKPALSADLGIAPDSMPRFLRLLTQDLFIERHHNHVVKVVAKPGVRQHTDDVGEIVQLMFRKEFVMQVEATKDHVHLRHVVVVVAMKWVV